MLQMDECIRLLGQLQPRETFDRSEFLEQNVVV